MDKADPVRRVVRGTPARRVAVLGAGSWGTCLALLLHAKGESVALWARHPERADAIRSHGENRTYLPGVPVPASLPISTDLAESLRGAHAVVFSVPSRSLRDVARASAPHIDEHATLVSAVKGIEEESLRRMSEVLSDEAQRSRAQEIVALAGPSHSEEVARQMPTAVAAASPSAAAAERVRDLFMTDSFRVYTNDDLLGVELAVSLKNIIAIAAGLCDGLGFGDNTRGALLTRGLAEITRLGVALGARERTFWGLAGIGDLVTTCVSNHSRNRRLGEEIARGRSLSEALERIGMVAEGVPTTRSAVRLAERTGVEMPITREVHAILFEGREPLQAMDSLMRRVPKSELV
ncbi:MAG: NAD(P)H-dependent glycerol-3-phosphate dehydrogenase [bacterium]